MSDKKKTKKEIKAAGDQFFPKVEKTMMVVLEENVTEHRIETIRAIQVQRSGVMVIFSSLTKQPEIPGVPSFETWTPSETSVKFDNVKIVKSKGVKGQDIFGLAPF
jgi:hypothetical protein